MDNDVSLIKTSLIGLFILGLLLLFFSWEYRSFPAILAFFVVIIALGAVLLPQYKHITVPIITRSHASGCRDSSAVCYSSSQSLTQYDATSGYAAGGYRERIPVLAIDQIQVFTQAEKLPSRNNLRCYLYYWK